MTIDVGIQLSSLAALFAQSPQRSQAMAIGDTVQASMEVLQLSLARSSIDRTATTGFITLRGFITGTPAACQVPAGKMWAITGFTVSATAGTDQFLFNACVANAAGVPLIVAQGITATNTTPNPISGAAMWPIPFFLKAGDQLGAWIGSTNATGDSFVTASWRFVELPAF